jgi:fimbrial chaperone protein
MKKLVHAIPQTLLGFLLMAAVASSHAGSVQITPVRINLSGAAKVAVLTVHNTGAEESIMQVTLNKWVLGEQGYAYEPSQELVVTPLTFRLTPGDQQIVRIGLRGNAPIDNEAAYRLLVEEVPQPASAGSTQTRLLVRHDLPLFIAPARAAKPALDIAVTCAANGPHLRINNIGNVHSQVRSVVLADVNSSAMLARWDTFDYLLPGAQKTWELGQLTPSVVNKTLVITTLTDQGAFTANVNTTCP